MERFGLRNAGILALVAVLLGATGALQAQTWTTTWGTVVDEQGNVPNKQIYALALDPSNPQIAYAGTWGSGVFKTTSGGDRPPDPAWVPINGSPDHKLPGNTSDKSMSIYSLAVDPSHPAIIYAGTYEHGVYKSMDGGGIWYPSGLDEIRVTCPR